MPTKTIEYSNLESPLDRVNIFINTIHVDGKIRYLLLFGSVIICL